MMMPRRPTRRFQRLAILFLLLLSITFFILLRNSEENSSESGFVERNSTAKKEKERKGDDDKVKKIQEVEIDPNDPNDEYYDDPNDEKNGETAKTTSLRAPSEADYFRQAKMLRNTVIPVIVFGCNRVTISRALDSLLKHRHNSRKFPIYVSLVIVKKVLACINVYIIFTSNLPSLGLCG